MKRLASIAVCMGILFAIASVSLGEDFTGVIYLGGGVSYTIPDFDDDWGDDAVQTVNVSGYSMDLDNSVGAYIKGGYFLSEFVAIEGLFQYLGEMTSEQAKAEWQDDVSIKGITLTVNAKGYLPGDMGSFMPYGVLGLGLGRFEYDGIIKEGTTAPDPSFASENDDYTGLFLRGGGGCTVMVAENVGLEAEVTYGLGTGDIDVAKMITVTGGIIIIL